MTLDKPKWMFHGPGVCADAQCKYSTWLEELASDSKILQAQEDIMSARVMASNIRAKLYVNLRWLFDDISGSMCSFGLSSFMNLGMVSLLPWIAAGSSRKSI